MNNRILKGVTAGILSAAMLSACGGGGSGTTPPVSGGGTQSKKTNVTIAFTVPGKKSAIAHLRHRDNPISPSTQGLGVSVVAHGAGFPATPQFAATIGAGTTANNVNCTAAAADGSYTCTMLVASPVGYDDFQFTAWDSPATNPGYGGTFSGNVLAIGVLSNQLIQLNQNNEFPVTMDSVVYSADVQVTPNSLVSGVPSTTSPNTGDPVVTVYAKDIDGNIIVGPDPYIDANGNTVTLHVAVTNNATVAFPTSIGTVQFGCPGTCVSTYDFTLPGQSASVHYNGYPEASATLALTASTGSPAGSLVGSTIDFTQSPGGVGFPGTPTIAEIAAADASPSGNYQGIALGPDGNVWYGENLTGASVGTNYVVQLVNGAVNAKVPMSYGPAVVVAGADGNVWTLAANGFLSKIDLAHSNAVTTPVSLPGPPADMAAGTDGAFYATDITDNVVWRLAIQSGGSLAPGLCSAATPSAAPNFIAAGTATYPVFWTESAVGKFGWYGSGTCGEAAPALTGSNLAGITMGPDGNMWFVEETGTTNGSIVGHFNPATPGTISECPVTMLNGHYYNIVAGPDGNLYLSAGPGSPATVGGFARVTTSCNALEFNTGLGASASPWTMTVGPSASSPYTANSAIWFIETNNGTIGTITP